MSKCANSQSVELQQRAHELAALVGSASAQLKQASAHKHMSTLFPLCMCQRVEGSEDLGGQRGGLLYTV